MQTGDIQLLIENPLIKGIKIIGIGKHGSKPLSGALIEEIRAYLQQSEVVPIQKGAFFGALLAKGITQDEQQLLALFGEDAITNPEKLYAGLCPDSPADMKPIGVKLLSGKYLTLAEAQLLGKYLFSDLPGETYRGMAASMLRIRYETDEEYQGLLEAANQTYTSGFQTNSNISAPAIQLAEPFDGVEHSYMITPLVARALQKAGYPVIVTLGRLSGPKKGITLSDIYQALGGEYIESNTQLSTSAPEYGWVLDQKILSPALDEWVDRRRLILKRPFLATLEKVLNPCGAKILVTSVFHITYMEKMVTLADMAGFTGVMVLKRGLEGTLAPSIARASGILCASRQPDGTFITQSFEAEDEILAIYRAGTDEVIEQLTIEENAALIHTFTRQGFTGNEDFDKRVNLAIALYQTGLNWITTHMSV